MLNKSMQKMTYAGFVFVLLALPVSAEVKEPAVGHPSLEKCQRYVKDTLYFDCLHMCNHEVANSFAQVCVQACEKMEKDFSGACYFWNSPTGEKPAS